MTGSQRQYQRIRALGLCTQCHKAPHMPDNVRCEECRESRLSENRKTVYQTCGTCGEDGHKSPTCPNGSPERCICGLALPCDHSEMTSRASNRREWT